MPNTFHLKKSLERKKLTCSWGNLSPLIKVQCSTSFLTTQSSGKIIFPHPCSNQPHWVRICCVKVIEVNKVSWLTTQFITQSYTASGGIMKKYFNSKCSSEKSSNTSSKHWHDFNCWPYADSYYHNLPNVIPILTGKAGDSVNTFFFFVLFTFTVLCW